MNYKIMSLVALSMMAAATASSTEIVTSSKYECRFDDKSGSGPKCVGLGELRVSPQQVGYANEPGVIAIQIPDSKCRIRQDDQAVCSGNNEFGQLGDGTNVHKNAEVVFTLPPGERAKQVINFKKTTFVLTKSGKLYAAGLHYSTRPSWSVKLASGKDENVLSISKETVPDSKVAQGGTMLTYHFKEKGKSGSLSLNPELVTVEEVKKIPGRMMWGMVFGGKEERRAQKGQDNTAQPPRGGK